MFMNGQAKKVKPKKFSLRIFLKFAPITFTEKLKHSLSCQRKLVIFKKQQEYAMLTLRRGLVYLLFGCTSTSLTVDIAPRFFYALKSTAP